MTIGARPRLRLVGGTDTRPASALPAAIDFARALARRDALAMIASAMDDSQRPR